MDSIFLLCLTLTGCPPNTPLSDEDLTMYTGGNDSIMYAFDIKTTQIKWFYKTKGSVISSPAIFNDAIFFGSVDSCFYAIDTATGKLKWSYKTDGSIISCPYIQDKTVYFGSTDKNIYALDIISGKLKWKFQTNFFAGNSPIVENGILYYCSSDQYVYAINANDGSLKWKYLTPMMISSEPTILNNLLYFGTIEKKIYAINTDSGTINWTYDTKNGVQESITLHNDTLYAGDVSGYLYSLNTLNGKEIWIDDLVGEFGYLLSPIVKNSIVYVAGGKRVIAINNRTKNAMWINRHLINDIHGYISAGPTVTDNFVYIGAGNGKIYNINISNGVVKDSFITRASEYQPPFNGTVNAGPLITTMQGKTYYPGISGHQK